MSTFFAMISPSVGRGMIVGIYDKQNRMDSSNNKQAFLILKRDVVPGEKLIWKYDQTQGHRDKAPPPYPQSPREHRSTLLAGIGSLGKDELDVSQQLKFDIFCFNG